MVEVIKTDKETPPGGYYSQEIITGNFLYTAGQIAYNSETKKFINENIGDEIRQVMQNLSTIAPVKPSLATVFCT